MKYWTPFAGFVFKISTHGLKKKHGRDTPLLSGTLLCLNVFTASAEKEHHLAVSKRRRHHYDVIQISDEIFKLSHFESTLLGDFQSTVTLVISSYNNSRSFFLILWR